MAGQQKIVRHCDIPWEAVQGLTGIIGYPTEISFGGVTIKAVATFLKVDHLWFDSDWMTKVARVEITYEEMAS